ncbi:hypothetical protein [Aureimonas psammosilenae]|uniref:hypothetical protein n=1 Tax=Aureimonas psammosilenae TaxID=2495496 RepID=UPI0012609567|nr:hypothetical protein [Aureimonas psammosilenae]
MALDEHPEGALAEAMALIRVEHAPDRYGLVNDLDAGDALHFLDRAEAGGDVLRECDDHCVRPLHCIVRERSR